MEKRVYEGILMATLKDQIIEIVTREIGLMGKFIVKKQCLEHGIDIENITSKDLPVLAEAMAKVMKTFGGEDKAEKVKRDIMALR